MVIVFGGVALFEINVCVCLSVCVCLFVCLTCKLLMSAGRYDEDFVAGRMRQLRAWLTRMSRHPVVSQSEVFKHFVTCTDEKVRGFVLILILILIHTHSVVCDIV